MSSDTTVRLNKYLALERGISRRAADTLIEQGRVTIDDIIAPLGARVAPSSVIAVDGDIVQKNTKHSYLLLHKPPGYVCSRKQQGDTPTIYNLLPEKYHHLKPVGRLDADSSGILILTNDGDFAHSMTHPKFYKKKIYHVTLNHDLAPLHQQMINDFGVQLEDGPSKLSLEKISDNSRKEWTVVMSEGRNRQIRRTFKALGYNVTKLHRVQFGGYTIASLKSGEYTNTTKL